MAANLPDYVASAKPVPTSGRVPWYAGVAPTYAGVMVWFLFWKNLPGYGGTPGGMLSAGLGTALLGVVLGSLIIHFLFYLVPGLLGMKTGLPLYVVGTSTYGVTGGMVMPGLFMGVLQFFWVGFNAFFVAQVLCVCFKFGLDAKGDVMIPGAAHATIAIVWAVTGAVVGMKGIQYVAKFSTYIPMIPIAVLLILTASTISGVGKFSPDKLTAKPAAVAAAAKTTDAKADDKTDAKAEEAAEGEKAAPAKVAEKKAAPAKAEAKIVKKPLDAMNVILAIVACIVGFFATAGAAGVDIAMSCKDEKNVSTGGLVGIALATTFSCGLAVLIVAGYYGQTADVPAKLAGSLDPIALMDGGILSPAFSKVLMILLAISCFPGLCFSSFIAANSFRTVLPQVNPFLSVGCGVTVSCILAVSGWAGNAAGVFNLIGASFGPVCGSMVADYLLSGRKWAGPRAGVNLAGWISWLVGFVLGAPGLFAKIPGLEFYADMIPCPPMAAFIAGFVLYAVLSKVGLQSRTLAMPAAK